MGKLELGTLVEINYGNGDNKPEKFVVVKIDQSTHVITLENKKTGERIPMTFLLFEDTTGIKLDKRNILHG